MTGRFKFVERLDPDGWSLHAPGSTYEEIATGASPPLACGLWEEGERVIPEWAYHEAARLLAA